MPVDEKPPAMPGDIYLRHNRYGFVLLCSWEFEVLTSIKIISGDLRGRNDLKSKVSTLEELYDFFYNNTQKLHRTM